MSSEELKPCPFCGGDVQFHKDDECSGCHYIQCGGCRAFFDFATSADPENNCESVDGLRASIAPMWNRRADYTALEAECERLRSLLDELYPYVRGCPIDLWDRYHITLLSLVRKPLLSKAASQLNDVSTERRKEMTTKSVTTITDEQIAEIEALAIKTHESTADLFAYGNAINPSKFLALISRLRAAEKDALRYRHSFLMPDGGSDGGLHYVISYKYGMTSCKDKETIDEIIDQAMKGDK